MKKFLIIFTLVALVIGLILTAVYFSNLPTTESNELSLISSRTNLNSFRRSNQQVVCQDDVQLCEDGSYVSRDPAKGCSFTCGTSNQNIVNRPPNTENTISCPQDVKQCSDGSYVARDVNKGCEFKACPISKNTNTTSTSSAPINCGDMDVDQNGKLDVIDFQAFSTVYGKNCADTVLPSTKCGGKDVNLDGKVDDTDFRSYLERFNKPSCVL